MFNIILISDIKVAEKPMFRSESDKCGLEKCHLGALVTMMTMAMAIVLDDDDGGDDDGTRKMMMMMLAGIKEAGSQQDLQSTEYQSVFISPPSSIFRFVSLPDISILHILFHIFLSLRNISFV